MGKGKQLELVSKTCKKCGVYKDLAEFGLNRRTFDKKNTWCKPCLREADRCSGRRERKNERRRQPGARDAEYQKRRENPEKRRDYRLQYTYGINSDIYEKLFEFQGQGCAICGRNDPGGLGVKLYVDHNHTTGAVRGLLCHPCNWALGFIECDKFKRALCYLANPIYPRFLEQNGAEETKK